jgi:hypothetical protein
LGTFGTKLKPKSYKVEMIKINMKFVGKFNNLVMLTDMYKNEEDDRMKAKIKGQVADLNSEVTSQDFALLMLG